MLCYPIHVVWSVLTLTPVLDPELDELLLSLSESLLLDEPLLLPDPELLTLLDVLLPAAAAVLADAAAFCCAAFLAAADAVPRVGAAGRGFRLAGVFLAVDRGAAFC